MTLNRMFIDKWRNSYPIRWIVRWLEAWQTKRFRRLAWYANSEHLRMRAAQKLKDPVILKQLALEANQESIRHQAAMLIESQSFLTAVALNAWDIEQGRKVVGRIDNDLLLRRVSASARQDAVRIAAAEKLQNSKVLKQIALTTADLSLRWEVAQRLNDPALMADVALFKPSKPHLEAVRQQARRALLRHLDELSRLGLTSALLSFMHDQVHLPFKLEAFLRLPPDFICQSTLQLLSRHEFLFVSRKMIQQLLLKIRDAGWIVDMYLTCIACKHCRGKGQILIKTITAGQHTGETDSTACPECSGKGWIDYWEAVCHRSGSRRVVFKLPYSKSSRSESPPF